MKIRAKAKVRNGLSTVLTTMQYKQHKQLRLPHYDYASSGYYFITIVTKHRMHYFGNILKGKMVLSPMGVIVHKCWMMIPSITSYATVDAFVVMPDHVHGILRLDSQREILANFESVRTFQPQKRSVSIVVRSFKAAVTRAARELSPGIEVWQSRFYDRIVRNEKELQAVRGYIENNPMQWETDNNNSVHLKM